MINNKVSPLADKELQEYPANKELNLKTVTDVSEDYKDAAFVIIATSTNYDENRNFFDTSSVEAVIRNVIASGSNAVIVVKSIIPVGFVEMAKKKYSSDNIMFSPEFLREGRALYDNMYPSKI